MFLSPEAVSAIAFEAPVRKFAEMGVTYVVMHFYDEYEANRFELEYREKGFKTNMKGLNTDTHHIYVLLVTW